MNRHALCAMVGAAIACLAMPAGAVVTMEVTETAANLANVQALLGAFAPKVTFKSSLPGQADFPDELTAFGMTKKGEKGLIVEGGADVKSLSAVSEVAFYDDAAMKKLSDLVVLYVDDRGRQAVGFVSHDATPEPATWAMLLVGFMGLGAALRGTRGLAPLVDGGRSLGVASGTAGRGGARER